MVWFILSSYIVFHIACVEKEFTTLILSFTNYFTLVHAVYIYSLSFDAHKYVN